mgnify:CR=1 FL=1
MINKACFCGILNVLEQVSYQANHLKRFIGRDINEDEFPYNYMIDQIHFLADGFFNDAQLESNRCGNRNFFYDCDKEFKSNYEVVRDLIYHYCFTSEFGRSLNCNTENVLTVMDRVKDTSICNFDMTTCEELYTLIVEWINRDPKDNSVEYRIAVPTF